MRIENATFNMVYSKIPDLRRKFTEFEDKLQEHFLVPFELVPVPDSAPEDIPRIIATSKGGHTKLNISLANTQFTTTFDQDYPGNIDKCIDYLKERIRYISETFSTFTDGNYFFSGLTVNIMFDDINENPIDLISEKFLTLESNLVPFDISNRVTYVIDDKYYVNINISNVRTYEGSLPQGAKTLYGLRESSHKIGLTLDTNDRYGFNFKKNYVSTYENIDKILEITRNILEKKAYKLIKEGVLEL